MPETAVAQIAHLVLFERQVEAMEKYALSMRVSPVTETERALMGDFLRQTRGLQTLISKLRRHTTAD